MPNCFVLYSGINSDAHIEQVAAGGMSVRGVSLFKRNYQVLIRGGTVDRYPDWLINLLVFIAIVTIAAFFTWVLVKTGQSIGDDPRFR